jgi:hypothetical protein
MFITSANDHQWSSWSLGEVIKGPANRAFSVQFFSRQCNPDSVPAPGSLRRFPSVGALISSRHLPGVGSIINLADHEIVKVQLHLSGVFGLASGGGDIIQPEKKKHPIQIVKITDVFLTIWLKFP